MEKNIIPLDLLLLTSDSSSNSSNLDINIYDEFESDILSVKEKKIDETQIKQCENIFKDCYYDKLENLQYFPCSGIINSRLTTYNEFIHDRAQVFFKILDKFKLNYFVFAGSSIGYLRNGRNIPWCDDYDIIVFIQDVTKLYLTIIPFLKLNEFDVLKTSFGLAIISQKNDLNSQDLKKNKIKSYFQCDIFFSHYVKNILKNANVKKEYGGGLYNRKNVPKQFVEPKSYKMFDGIKLPFFNEVEKDVQLEYGDIFNKCILHIRHKPSGIINGPWEDTYQYFYRLIENAKENVKKIIYINPNYKPEKTMKLDIGYNSIYEIMKYISKNNIGIIFVLSLKFIKHLQSIKYYYPNIKIILYLFENTKMLATYLNYVDEVKFKLKETFNYYNHNDMIYIHKPKFKLINVITFGTYDLLHIGHINIFKRAKTYGYKLIVGISTDQLNIAKGKKTIQNYNTIYNNIKKLDYIDSIFPEDKLELKDQYIKEHDADILIMGDDWKNKFDWVSCPVLYLPRTPNISTTILKEKLNKQESIKKLVYTSKKIKLEPKIDITSNIKRIIIPKNKKIGNKLYCLFKK